jgi:N-methylhydantoinase A
MRYRGQGHEIRVDLPNDPKTPGYLSEIIHRFQDAYQKIYGYHEKSAAIEGVDWYLSASIASGVTAELDKPKLAKKPGAARRTSRKAYFPEYKGFTNCAIIDRYKLALGEVVEGPAIVEERESTTLILPNDRATLTENGNLVILIDGAQQ